VFRTRHWNLLAVIQVADPSWWCASPSVRPLIASGRVCSPDFLSDAGPSLHTPRLPHRPKARCKVASVQLLILEVRPLGPPDLSRGVTANVKIAFTAEDRVRGVVHNVNSHGFDSPASKYARGHPPKLTLPKRQAIKKVAQSDTQASQLPFRPRACPSRQGLWSPRGAVDHICHA